MKMWLTRYRDLKRFRFLAVWPEPSILGIKDARAMPLNWWNLHHHHHPVLFKIEPSRNPRSLSLMWPGKSFSEIGQSGI